MRRTPDDAAREAPATAWAVESAKAVTQPAIWIERNGLPLAKWQTWRPE